MRPTFCIYTKPGKNKTPAFRLSLPFTPEERDNPERVLAGNTRRSRQILFTCLPDTFDAPEVFEQILLL